MLLERSIVELERRNGTFWKGSSVSKGEKEKALPPLNKVALRGTIRVGKRMGKGGSGEGE